MEIEKWPILLLFVDIPFFLFALSMIYFLFNQILKRNPEFNGGFYILFLMLTIGDSVCYFQYIFFNRIPLSGSFPEFYLGNSTLLHIWDNSAYTLNGFLTSFDLIGHTFIAFNRFTTLFLSQQYHYIWSGRRLFLIISMLFLLSLLSVSYRIYGPFQYILTPDGMVGMYDSIFIRQIFLYERTLLTVSTSVITLIFEAATAIKYRLMWKQMNWLNKAKYNKDRQLFIHSILMYISQSLLTSYFVIYWMCLWKKNNALLHVAQQFLVPIYDLLCLGGPVFLFCVSTVVQKYYLDFYTRQHVVKMFFKKSTNMITYVA